MPSPFVAFCVLIVHSFARHWRVRQMGFVAIGLLAITVTSVAINTARPGGWQLPDRRVSRSKLTYREYASDLRTEARYDRLINEPPLPLDTRFPIRPTVPDELVPNPLDPTRSAFQSLLLTIPHAVLQNEKFLHGWALMQFSRWVVFGAFVGFILPLFTLSYASGAFGTERENRTMIWLMTRPMPRSAVYLAKWLGSLPWCLFFGVGGFVALCLAGNALGREALALYWPAAIAGTVAFSALFHLIGALFRRPVVVGLVYVFFYEALVSTLPGSMKLISLSFYVRSLMYNKATAAQYTVSMLNVSEPVSSLTAWCVLVAATISLTALGMWLFSRSEYRDDV